MSLREIYGSAATASSSSMNCGGENDRDELVIFADLYFWADREPVLTSSGVKIPSFEFG